MFGYLTAVSGELTEEQLARYRACYCGLCRCLYSRHGTAARLTLNYDMTFLILLLNSLYEPEEDSGEEACIVHPFHARKWQSGPCTEYAADLNTALAYLKCLDDWEDDGNPMALFRARTLQRTYEAVCVRYPRQSAVIRESLKELNRLEKEHIEDPDAAANCFGRLMGELFVWREDRWSKDMRTLGEGIGRFLYVLDAFMDLDADAAFGRYNPFRRYYGRQGNRQRFEEILKMLLADCLPAFDRLPLVQDNAIMKNILCAGLWSQFNRKYRGKKDTADGSGSL